VCGSLFTFNPHRVPSIPIDPANNLPPDLGGDPARAVRQQLCASCMETVNANRESRGLEPWPVLPGAYDPVPEGEL